MGKLMVFLLLILVPAAAVRADIPAMMTKIVQLRGELETLNREMETALKDRQADLDLWSQKRLELEGQMQKETLRQLQLEEKTKRLSARVKSEAKADPRAKTEFMNWLARGEDWVKSSLPFRRGPRSETLQNLRERAERGLESPEVLSSEFWQFYESEMKLALANEYRITEVETVGKAEVARLGLYTLFAKSTDGSLRQAVLAEGTWTLQPVAEEIHADVERLLQNLKNKKDQGLYAIPWAQPIVATKENL